MPSLKSRARKPRPRPVTVVREDANNLTNLTMTSVVNLEDLYEGEGSWVVVTFNRSAATDLLNLAGFTLFNPSDEGFQPSDVRKPAGAADNVLILVYDNAIVGGVVSVRVNLDGPTVIDGVLITDGVERPVDTAYNPNP